MYFGRVTTPPRQPPRPPPRPPPPPPRSPGPRPAGSPKPAPSKAAASAKAAFAKAAGSPLFRRARNMLFRPRNEWNTISSEFTNASTIYKSYVIPLSAIGPIATMLGALVFGKVGTMFGPLVLLGLVYTLWLLALGVPVVMKVPGNAPEKATAYRLIAVIVALVLILIFEAVAGVFGA